MFCYWVQDYVRPFRLRSGSFRRANSGDLARIKRRSAFVKHLKAKHAVDLAKTTIEEAAASLGLLTVPLCVEKAGTPPPTYHTAAKERIYQEEDLPTFPSDVAPKEEVYTPSALTPPPAVIDVIPSSEGFRWSSGDFVGSCFHLWRTSLILSLTASTCPQTTRHLALALSAVPRIWRFLLIPNTVLNPRCWKGTASSIPMSPNNPPHITNNRGPGPQSRFILSLRPTFFALPRRLALRERTTTLLTIRMLAEISTPNCHP